VTPEYAKPKTDLINPIVSENMIETKDGGKVIK